MIGNLSKSPKAYFLALFLFQSLIFSYEVFAQEPLAWKDAVQEARKNHPDLVSAKEKINQSSASKAITASGFFPQIGGNADGQTTTTRSSTASSSDSSEPSSSTSSRRRTDSYSYGVSGTQLLFDGFKTAYDVEQAARNIDFSKYNYDVTSSNVRFNLRSAFISLLRAQELLHITEKIAVRRKQSRDLIDLRYDAGREHKGSLLTAEANLAQADFEVEQAKRSIEVSARRLARQMGRIQWTSIEAKGDLDAVFNDHRKPDFEGLAETNPFLRALIVQKEAAKWGVKSSQADFFPQVYANASADRNGSTWPPDETRWSAGVSASVPLFEGGRLVAGVSKAKAALNQAGADERSGRDGVILTLEETWAAFQDASEQVDVQEKFLRAAEERAKISVAQYSSGLISFDDWIIIEDNLVKAEKSFLDARANALLSEAAWRQAKGETLDEE